MHMSKLIRTVAAIAFAAAAASAHAHGKLITSDPANGANLDRAPTEVRLQFSEPVEAAFTTVKLVGPDAKEVSTGATTVDKTDAKTVVLPVPALTAGAYKAAWTMVGPDGHKVKGTVAFSVK